MYNIDFIAILGATTGTIALFLDIYKHFTTGNKLTIHALSNVSLDKEVKKLIKFQVNNIGDKDTKIETIYIEYYKNWLSYIFHRNSFKLKIKYFFNHSNDLPCKIIVGENWIGYLYQEIIENILIENKIEYQKGIICGVVKDSVYGNIYRSKLVCNTD